jgi:hypothetical protein
LPLPAHDPMLANTFEPSLRRCLRFFTPRRTYRVRIESS